MLANQITRLANPEEADLLIEICNVFFAIITLVSSANIAGLCWKLCEMFISEKILIFVSFSLDDRCTDLGSFYPKLEGVVFGPLSTCLQAEKKFFCYLQELTSYKQELKKRLTYVTLLET